MRSMFFKKNAFLGSRKTAIGYTSRTQVQSAVFLDLKCTLFSPKMQGHHLLFCLEDNMKKKT